jgi:hypothetical protein
MRPSVRSPWQTPSVCHLESRRRRFGNPRESATQRIGITEDQPWLTLMDLRSSTVLHESGQPIERVYFPVSGMVSLLAVMQSGEAIETGVVGADGLLGGDAAINGHLFGQLDDAALTMPKARFVYAYLAQPHLRNLVDRYQRYFSCRRNRMLRAMPSIQSVVAFAAGSCNPRT